MRAILFGLSDNSVGQKYAIAHNLQRGDAMDNYAVSPITAIGPVFGAGDTRRTTTMRFAFVLASARFTSHLAL